MLIFRMCKIIVSAFVLASASVTALAAYDGGAYKASCTQARVARTAAEEAKISSAEIVFYGDSRMESTCRDYQNVLKVYETTLPQAVAKELGIGGLTHLSGYTKILDRARDATSTANLNYSGYTPEWSLSNYLTNGTGGSVISANVVVLAYGTNDVWYDPTSGATVAFPERLRQMATVALNAGKSVVFVTPYKVCDYLGLIPVPAKTPGTTDEQYEVFKQQYLDQKVAPYVGYINQIYTELSSSYSGRVALAALHNLSSFDCSINSPQTSDGLHANQSSILEMAKVVADAVASVSGPYVKSEVSKSVIVYDESPRATFGWTARGASSVSVQCSGSVAGNYSGGSVKDAIYMIPVSYGEGTCTVTARNSAGRTSTQSQTVMIQAPPPIISTSISKTSLIVGENRSAVFSWVAANAGTVNVSCTGAVTGSYSGSSLNNGIYVETVSVGSGTCTATAYGGGGQTAVSSKSVTVQSDAPTISSSVDRVTLTIAGGPTIFRWNATNANSISVVCSGSVAGSYAGPSLQNGIYVHPVSVGSGVCSATASNATGKSAVTSVTIVVSN